MDVKKTKVEGVNILRPEVFQDERGFFYESYNKEKLEKMGIYLNLCQDNHSMSKEIGTIKRSPLPNRAHGDDKNSQSGERRDS